MLRFAPQRTAPPRFVSLRFAPLRTASIEVCLAEVCLAEVCLAEVCSAEVCPAEVCPAEVCLEEVCPAEVCPAEVCLEEVCPAEVCLDEVYLGINILSPPLIPPIYIFLEKCKLLFVCHICTYSCRPRRTCFSGNTLVSVLAAPPSAAVTIRLFYDRLQRKANMNENARLITGRLITVSQQVLLVCNQERFLL